MTSIPRIKAPAKGLLLNEVIAAIRQRHLKANIDAFERDPRAVIHWDRATVDPGGTIFGPGPYLTVPVTHPEWGVTMQRVYPPARLRRTLARALGLEVV